jgi:hypothetical protein
MGSPGSVSTFTQFYDGENSFRRLYSRVQNYQVQVQVKFTSKVLDAQALQTLELTSSSQALKSCDVAKVDSRDSFLRLLYSNILFI